MKSRIRKILFFDKALLALSFMILVTIIFTVISVIYAGNFENKNRELKNQISELQTLSGEVIQLKAVVESKENKISLKKSAGIVSTLEQILKTLNLEAKIIKPLGTTKLAEFTEENAELEIQGTDLNSIVNLLYRIDISLAPLKIKNALVKTTFEDPEKFILKFTVSLMSRG